jgi:hypothetical protein
LSTRASLQPDYPYYDVTQNELVWRLKEEVARLEGQRARVLTYYRPTAAGVSQIEAHLDQARQRLGTEIASVVDQQRTSRQTALEAASRLRYAWARIVGVVLNRVDPRAQGYARYFEPYA